MRPFSWTFLASVFVAYLVGCEVVAALALRTYEPSLYPSTGPESSMLKRSLVLAQYREIHLPFRMFVPITAAAAELETVLNEILSRATDYMAMGSAESSCIEFGLGDISVFFISSNPQVPVQWQFIVHLADHLLGEVSKGWTGEYKAGWINKVTGVAIGITMLRQ